MSGPRPKPSEFLGKPPQRERALLGEVLRTETAGGAVLLFATVVALIMANTGLRDAYEDAKDLTFGVDVLHLRLSVAEWATDGLLTVFFFVAGIELKRELVVGGLRDPRAAALPIVSAVCGMLVPALCYLAFTATTGGELSGWAIPAATDIAFALGVLAVVGDSLPAALRAFLLTLAIVDDLGAIVIIAVFFSAAPSAPELLGAAAALTAFWFLHHRGVRGWYVYVPLALLIWALVHAGGVHATVAGVAMGLLLRVKPQEDEEHSPAERIEHRVRPLSAGVAVPLFALFAAGIEITPAKIADVFSSAETLGIVCGLVVGKAIGVVGGAFAAARFTRAVLNPDLRWADVTTIGMLAGIGFTVSLLISELAFADTPVSTGDAKAAVLTGSVLAALAASVLIRARSRHYRRLAKQETELSLTGPGGAASGASAYHLRMARLLERKATEHRRLAAEKRAEKRAEKENVTHQDDDEASNT